MKRGLIYIHGKGGSALEVEHYKPLFPDIDAVGMEYSAETPWEAIPEFSAFYDTFMLTHSSVIIIASSIGAFFALHALADKDIEKLYLISPILDMEQLINDMMSWAQVTEDELRSRGTIETAFGETLSYDYLQWVRNNPLRCSAPVAILRGSRDNMQSAASIKKFAERFNAVLTEMPDGEHWFHTDEQMNFLDHWILTAF